MLLVYYYEIPPAYNVTVTLLTLSILALIPFLSLPLVYWQLSNCQIFDNLLFEIQKQDDVRVTGHYDFKLFDQGHLSHASGPLLLFYFIILSRIVVEFKRICSEKEELELVRADEEENLDYSQAVDTMSRQRLITNERHFFENYGIRTWTKDQFSRLEKAADEPAQDGIIENIPTYRMIEIPKYMIKFQYTPVMMRQHLKKRTRLEHDCTFIALNLPYLTQEQIKTINFDFRDKNSELFPK